MNRSHGRVVPALTAGLAGVLCGALAWALPAQAAEPGRILIVKTDQFADPVEGAVFEAFASDGDSSFEPSELAGDGEAAECTSDATAECVLGPLEPGDYFVRELSAPVGYTGDDRVRGPITIDEGATVLIDRATDLDGDGLSDGFLNVRKVTAGGGDPYDTYDDDPGASDFKFDTPFDDDDDPGAGGTATNPGAGIAGQNQPAQPTADRLTVAGDSATQPAVSSPANGALASIGELPRTGTAAQSLAVIGGILLMLGGFALLADPRRRPAPPLTSPASDPRLVAFQALLPGITPPGDAIDACGPYLPAC